MSREVLEEAKSKWQKKLAYYERELSITSGVEQKFELREKILECEKEIHRLNTRIYSINARDAKQNTSPQKPEWIENEFNSESDKLELHSVNSLQFLRGGYEQRDITIEDLNETKSTSVNYIQDIQEKVCNTGTGKDGNTTSASSSPIVNYEIEICHPVQTDIYKSDKPFCRPIFKFETVTVNLRGQEVKRYQGQVRYRSENLSNGVYLDLVSITRGRFIMGSPDSEPGQETDETPQRLVTVDAFLIGKYPITQAQWRVVADLPKINCELNSNPSHFKGAALPVEMVSWYEVQEFCARLSKLTGKEYRLPSEAEWEYACRAGTVTPFHFGKTITTDLANYNGEVSYGGEPKGQYRQETTEVGSFQVANAFGLYDMHGNVGEWCLDYWHENYEKAPQDHSVWLTGGDSNYRLIRGGVWSLYPKYCRSANRSKNQPDLRSSRIGFRVVCSSVKASR